MTRMEEIHSRSQEDCMDSATPTPEQRIAALEAENAALEADNVRLKAAWLAVVLRRP